MCDGMTVPDGIDEDLWRKILALREMMDPSRGATSHEIEVVTAKLNTLLLKHNLSLAMLDTGPATSIEHHMFVTDVETMTWEMILLKTLADENFCRVIADDTRRVFAVIGKPHNIAATWETYMWLGPKIMEVALAERKKKQDKGRPKEEDFTFGQWITFDSYTNMAIDQPARWLQSFLIGMVEGIGQAMKDARREVLAQDNRNTALVPIMNREVDDYVEDNFSVDKKPLEYSAEQDIYRSGKQAGRNIDIHKRKELSQ